MHPLPLFWCIWHRKNHAIKVCHRYTFTAVQYASLLSDPENTLMYHFLKLKEPGWIVLALYHAAKHAKLPLAETTTPQPSPIPFPPGYAALLHLLSCRNSHCLVCIFPSGCVSQIFPETLPWCTFLVIRPKFYREPGVGKVKDLQLFIEWTDMVCTIEGYIGSYTLICRMHDRKFE